MLGSVARCTEQSCPVRYRSGDDRPCLDHADDDQVRADMAEFLSLPPGSTRDDGGESAGDDRVRAAIAARNGVPASRVVPPGERRRRAEDAERADLAEIARIGDELSDRRAAAASAAADAERQVRLSQSATWQRRAAAVSHPDRADR